MYRLLKRVSLWSLLFISSSASAQETQLKIGAASNITSTNSLMGSTVSVVLSTSEVDAFLGAFAPAVFGNNFTRDKSNKVFADFSSLKLNLATSLKQVIPTLNPKIRSISSIIIDTPRLNLRLSQKTNSVSAELGTLKVSTNLIYNSNFPVICPYANISLDINITKVMADYNYITGNINNSDVIYTVDNIKSSCGGILGFVGDAFNSVFLGGSRAEVKSAIKSEVDSRIAFANMKTLFSLADFAKGLKAFALNRVISSEANLAVNVLSELVDHPNISTPSIILDVGVDFSALVSNANNISMIVSHAPVDIIATSPGRYELSVPPNTTRTDLYYQSDTKWVYFATTNSNIAIFPVNARPVRSYVIAIGRNSYFPTLSSFPGRAFLPLDSPGGIHR
jgi:hypothetical protein